MKIRMTSQISGMRDGEPWPAGGETIDVPADEGKNLCESGLAEPVDSRHDKVENAKKADTSEKRSGGLTTQGTSASGTSKRTASKSTASKSTAAKRTAKKA